MDYHVTFSPHSSAFRQLTQKAELLGYITEVNASMFGGISSFQNELN